MPVDLATLAATMPQSVPFVATLGLEFLAVDATSAVLRLPDEARLHNHVGGPHAGALFTLGETASGAVVLAAFGDDLGRATPLAAGAQISYAKLARGPVTARATLGRDADEIRTELDAGELPQFDVAVEFRDGDDVVTGTMTVRWALKPTTRSA